MIRSTWPGVWAGTLLGAVLAAGLIAAPASMPAARPAPHGSAEFVPQPIPGHQLHARQAFLGRVPQAWEAMDVWVPNTPGDGPLPCLIVLYGGGYGERVGGTRIVSQYAGHGYVLACPDYTLGSRAAVPQCAWDVADAVRYLRANAAKYRIDPERIGVSGFSAGGWIAQDLFYAGPERVVANEGTAKDKKALGALLPMVPPHPVVHPEQSYRVQAVISDWGAGKLWARGNKNTPDRAVPWLTSDDPPLLTIYNDQKPAGVGNPVQALQALGVPARGLYGHVGNTHVPAFTAPVVDEEGKATTWGEEHFRFLDANLKNVKVATAPEMRPHGGFIREPTTVELLTVHPKATIHYTLDGKDPAADAPTYTRPVLVQPGQTLKAIAIRPGLAPSPIASGTFAKSDLVQPRITTGERVIHATAGRPLSVQFKAQGALGATWSLAGHVGDRVGTAAQSPYEVWVNIDPKSGLMTGTPRLAGVYPMILSCWRTAAGGASRNPAEWVADALTISVVVEPEGGPHEDRGGRGGPP